MSSSVAADEEKVDRHASNAMTKESINRTYWCDFHLVELERPDYDNAMIIIHAFDNLWNSSPANGRVQRALKVMTPVFSNMQTIPLETRLANLRKKYNIQDII